MAVIHEAISDGQLKRNKQRIREELARLIGTVKSSASRILFDSIPTYLHHTLYVCIYIMIGAYRTWWPYTRPVPVYDLLNCGPRNQFMAGRVIAHNCQFGAGVQKVMDTLEADDIFLPFEQVETIHRTYWETFARLKEFSRELWHLWRRNGGHIVNGLGRPMAVPENMTKDLLSRFIQSTGHDILVKYISILAECLDGAEIPWRPVIMDWHDATTVEVPEEYGERTVAVFYEALERLNKELAGNIRMRGVPTVGRTMADVKEPEE